MTSLQHASKSGAVEAAAGGPEVGRRRGTAEASGPGGAARPLLPPGAAGPVALLGLQRAAGNRAAAALAVEHAGRHEPEPAQVAQRENGTTHTPPLLSETARRRAESIRGTVQSRILRVDGYNAIADRAIATYRDKRLTYAESWGQAWANHSNVLTQAGEQAATQNIIEGVVIGAVASVVVAAAAALVFPAAAAAATFSAGWWAFNAGTAAVASGAGTATATAVGRPSVPGPSAGRRDAEADAWQAIANVERTARHVSSCAPKFGLELGNAEYSIAQVQAHIDDSTKDMTWSDTLDMVSTLANWEIGLGSFDTQLGRATTSMERFEAAINEWEPPPADRLEREIWQAWMAQLEDSEPLDQDRIQEVLEGMGLLRRTGVFGSYLTDADQDRAVAEARRHSAESPPPPPSR